MSDFALGIVLAIAASTCLNVGKGVQKWKVQVLRHKAAAFSAAHRKDLVIWLLGIGMTTAATGLFSMALKYSDKPSTVSALNGVGLIGLVLFAWAVLKEKVGPREVLGAALVIGGTALMGLLDVPAEAVSADIPSFWMCVGGIFGLFGPLAVFSWLRYKWHGVIFGAFAGCLIGSAMVLGDIALVEAGDDFSGQFSGPYTYLALVVGTVALFITQAAFWRASAMVVVPTTNSFVILAPLVIQYFVFGTVLQGVQYGGIAIIVVGVVLLTMGGGGEATLEREKASLASPNT